MRNFNTDAVLLQYIDGNIVKIGDTVPEGLVVGINISSDYLSYGLRVLTISGNEIELDITTRVKPMLLRGMHATEIIHLGNNMDIQQDKHTLILSGLRVPAVKGFLTAEDSEKVYGKYQYILPFDTYDLFEFQKGMFSTIDEDLSDVFVHSKVIINLIYATESSILELKKCISDALSYNISQGVDWTPYPAPRLSMSLGLSGNFYPTYPKPKIEPTLVKELNAFQAIKEKFTTTFFGK